MDLSLLQKNLECLKAADETADVLNNILTMLTSSNIEMVLYDIKQLTINSIESLEKCVDVIFDNAINNESQRMFATLCTKLSLSSVPVCKDSQKMITFREQLLKKSRREVLNFVEQQTLIKAVKSDAQSDKENEFSDGDDEKVVHVLCSRPIALFKFIAELFLVDFLPSCFVKDCVSQLLDDVFCNENTLETFYALMKIAGNKLEAIEKIDLTEEFEQLKKKKSSIVMNPHTKFMIVELFEMRDNQWKPVNEVDWIMLYNLFLCDVEEKLYVLELWYGNGK